MVLLLAYSSTSGWAAGRYAFAPTISTNNIAIHHTLTTTEIDYSLLVCTHNHIINLCNRESPSAPSK